jgi:hypothetical protein
VVIEIDPAASDADAGATADEGAGADVEADSGSGAYRVSVAVNKSRYAAPDRQVTTASGALAIYNERLPTNEGLRNARSRLSHWVPLGRDALLEADLLDRIAARAAGARPARLAERAKRAEELPPAEAIEELPKVEP